jgi:hypothetical protein
MTNHSVAERTLPARGAVAAADAIAVRLVAADRTRDTGTAT